MVKNKSKGLVLMICLFAGPFLQVLGDVLWSSRHYSYSWSIWREASYIFFVPAGFLLAKMIERKNFWWAVACSALFVTGCFGAAAMMPLFRLGAFYPSHGHYDFPTIVSSVLDKRLFAVTLYPPGLCFPVSLVLFGVAFLKFKLLRAFIGIALILSGVLFWLGNAGEMESMLIIGDAFLLLTLCQIGYLTLDVFKNQSRKDALAGHESAGTVTAAI